MNIQLLYRNHRLKNSTLSPLPNLNLSSLAHAQELMAKIAYERYLVVRNQHPQLTYLSIRPCHASVKVGSKTFIEMEIVQC
jgi:hypothetical protein